MKKHVAAPALGIALGLLFTCAVLFALERHRRASDAEAAALRPKSLAASGAVVTDDAGPLREVLMHYVPELEPIFATTYRDFLSAIAVDTRVVFVVRRGERGQLEKFLERNKLASSLAPRMRVIEIDTSLGIWSKDRALVLEPPSGKTELVIPPRPRPGEGSRPADWDIVPAVAAAMPDAFEVRQVPIAFDAGDFAIAGKHVLFDVNLWGRNRSRGFRSPQEMKERLKSIIGRDVVMLGTALGDVPRHHMSMYMAVLDGGTALVGDPLAGAELVGHDFIPGEASPETGKMLRADFSPETVARFEHAAADLTASGFHVVRIPTVPFDDKTYFAYTNGIYETRGGKRIAYVPQFGLTPIDKAANAVYEKLGWTVMPIRVRDVYTQHGTIGCLVNVLSRRE